MLNPSLLSMCKYEVGAKSFRLGQHNYFNFTLLTSRYFPIRSLYSGLKASLTVGSISVNSVH